MSLTQKLKGFLSQAVKPRTTDVFLGMCENYRARLARERFTWSPAPTPRRMGVLVTPWVSTAVPLFAVECLLMFARAGHRAVVLLDDADVVANSPDKAHGEALARLVRHLPPEIEVVSPAQIRPIADPGDAELAATLLRQNAIWRMRGEQKAHEFHEQAPDAAARLQVHLAAVRGLLSHARLDSLLLPGGVFGLSGVYSSLARQTALPFTSFDSGVGILRLAHDQFASHLGDIADSFARLPELLGRDPAIRAAAVARGHGELQDRTEARDFRQFQVKAAGARDDLRYDILIPLNIRWDTAALLRQKIFASVEDWLRAVLDWVAEHPTRSICIRQHPRERLAFAKGSDDLRPLIEEYARLGDRLRYVAAEEEINTYDLLRHASAVLPHTSTVGIEAAVLGKPAILSAHCYYENLGFVFPVADRAEYFARLEAALTGALTVTPEQREQATIAYFLTQHCALLRTDFTPHRSDFLQWVERSAEELWNSPETADLRAALLTRTPLSFLRAERLLTHAA